MSKSEKKLSRDEQRLKNIKELQGRRCIIPKWIVHEHFKLDSILKSMSNSSHYILEFALMSEDELQKGIYSMKIKSDDLVQDFNELLKETVDRISFEGRGRDKVRNLSAHIEDTKLIIRNTQKIPRLTKDPKSTYCRKNEEIIVDVNDLKEMMESI